MGLKMNQKGLIMDQQRFIAVLKRHIRQQVFVSDKPQKELSALKKLSLSNPISAKSAFLS